MSSPHIIIRLVEKASELERMYYVRWLILRQPLGLELGTEKDEYEQESWQIIALNNAQIVGCARLRKIAVNTGSLNYVAVLPEFQHQRIGTQMIQKSIKIAQQEQLKILILKARLPSLAFYQKLGFQKTGESFDFLGITHCQMFLDLKNLNHVENI